MASEADAPDVKRLIDEGVNKAAADVAEMADKATEALLGLVEQPRDLGDADAIKEVLRSNICQEILSRIAQKISKRQ